MKKIKDIIINTIIFTILSTIGLFICSYIIAKLNVIDAKITTSGYDNILDIFYTLGGALIITIIMILLVILTFYYVSKIIAMISENY